MVSFSTARSDCDGWTAAAGVTADVGVLEMGVIGPAAGTVRCHTSIFIHTVALDKPQIIRQICTAAF